MSVAKLTVSGSNKGLNPAARLTIGIRAMHISVVKTPAALFIWVLLVSRLIMLPPFLMAEISFKLPEGQSLYTLLTLMSASETINKIYIIINISHVLFS